jgi:hypothetical protein
VVHVVACAALVGESAITARTTWRAASTVVGTAANIDKGGDGRWRDVGSGCVRGVVLVHIVCQVEDASHHLINGRKVVFVEGVDDVRFGMTVWAVARNTAQHEEAEVVRVDGSGAIDHLTCLVIVVERLSHVVDIVIE